MKVHKDDIFNLNVINLVTHSGKLRLCIDDILDIYLDWFGRIVFSTIECFTKFDTMSESGRFEFCLKLCKTCTAWSFLFNEIKKLFGSTCPYNRECGVIMFVQTSVTFSGGGRFSVPWTSFALLSLQKTIITWLFHLCQFLSVSGSTFWINAAIDRVAIVDVKSWCKVVHRKGPRWKLGETQI